MTGFGHRRSRLTDDGTRDSRANTWVDAVGGKAVLDSIASELGVTIDDAQLPFLNRFADLVEKQVLKRAFGCSSSSIDAAAEVATLRGLVNEEATAAVKSLSEPSRAAVDNFNVIQSDDTGLPIMYLSVSGAPEIVVMVSRSYLTRRTGVSYGFRPNSGRSTRLTGAAAVAARTLDETCREVGWHVSITSLIQTWVDAVLVSVARQTQEASREQTTNAQREQNE